MYSINGRDIEFYLFMIVNVLNILKVFLILEHSIIDLYY